MSVFSVTGLVFSYLSIFALRVSAGVLSSYDNVFLDPHWILDQSAWNPNSTDSQKNIVTGAFDLANQGPWTVTSKTILPPSNNSHDYLSFAPYWWADCSNVHNTTELTQYEIWTQCVYVNRDGQFTSDQRLVNDTGIFAALGDAVLYSALAWRISGDDVHAANINAWINTWFVDESTAQTPNLNYAQLIRGVGKMVGAHTGLLDFKGMAKIATGILTLRLGDAPGWTAEVDRGLQAWVKKYLVWATTNELAIDEMNALNNHGSYFFNQLASLYILDNDTTNAVAAIDKYFNGIFMGQIDASVEQPEEADRTHPYHYRAYNLAAAMTNARIGEYLGYNAWNKTTNAGGTIQKAIDFAMIQNPASSNEMGAVPEMWPIVATAATKFGDPSGKYAKFLANTGAPLSQAFMFWDFHATLNETNKPLGTKPNILTTTISPSSTHASKPTSAGKSTSTGTGGSLRSAACASYGGVVAIALGAFGLLASLS